MCLFRSPSQNELNVSTCTYLHACASESRFIISSFAFLVKVIASIFFGSTLLNVVRNSIRFVRTVVFPDPAPAIHAMIGSILVIAFFCSSL